MTQSQWLKKTIADNNMKRGDDPVTMVKDSRKDYCCCVAYCLRMSGDILGTSWDQCVSMVQYCFTSTETIRLVETEKPRAATSTFTQLLNSDERQFPKHYNYDSPTARAHSAKSTGRTSNTATTANWSTKWKRDSSHTPRRLTMTKTGNRRHQVVTSSPVPATEHGEGCWQVSQTAAAKLRRHTATPDRCGANRQQPSTGRQRRHGSSGVNWRRWRIKMSWITDDQTLRWTNNTRLTNGDRRQTKSNDDRW